MGEESTESLREIMSSAFSEVKQENITALVGLVQSAAVETLRVKEWQEQLNSATWANSCSSLSCRLRSP